MTAAVAAEAPAPPVPAQTAAADRGRALGGGGPGGGRGAFASVGALEITVADPAGAAAAGPAGEATTGLLLPLSPPESTRCGHVVAEVRARFRAATQRKASRKCLEGPSCASPTSSPPSSSAPMPPGTSGELLALAQVLTSSEPQLPFAGAPGRHKALPPPGQGEDEGEEQRELQPPLDADLASMPRPASAQTLTASECARAVRART
mmetsp:Transcript_87062/g.186616  ORF Transcript_87062/g.186616 Transcript_87062/m.186616 type:complete len:207 (+) Transcript_87062:488-1108(+)